VTPTVLALAVLAVIVVAVLARRLEPVVGFAAALILLIIWIVATGRTAL